MSTSNGDGSRPHFDNVRLQACIARFQAQGDRASLAEIIELSQRRAQTLIRYYGSAHYCTESELLSDINFKLLRAVGKFDPQKGSAFCYISKIIDSSLRTSVTNTRKRTARFCEFDESIADTLHTNGESESRDQIEDLIHRIKNEAKTMLIDEREIEAQRWFVDSFCESGFAHRRHQCSDACIGAFNLTHSRSRELFDLTMLEVRRTLYDHVKPRREQIIPGRLYGTRCAWMTGFSELLSPAEFTKFVVLLKNLAPYLLLLVVDPTKANNHRRDRNPTIGRQTLELILSGHPDAVRLFP